MLSLCGANADLIDTSFELPEWTTGSAMQNGWSDQGWGAYTITDTFARTGTQSVRWPGDGIWLFTPEMSFSGQRATSKVWLYIDFGNELEDDMHGISAHSPGLEIFFGWIGLRANGQVWTDSHQTGWHYSGITISNQLDRWIEVTLEVDVVEGGEITGLVDGISTNIGFYPFKNPELDHFAITSNAAGNGGLAYFDDFSAVPEPSTLIGIGVGLAWVASLRRRAVKLGK